MRRRLSYFEKRLLLREESLIRKRDFYKEKVSLEKEHDFNFDFCLLKNIEKDEKMHCHSVLLSKVSVPNMESFLFRLGGLPRSSQHLKLFINKNSQYVKFFTNLLPICKVPHFALWRPPKKLALTGLSAGLKCCCPPPSRRALQGCWRF